MARTTLDLDADLVATAQELAGGVSKKAVIEEALREFVSVRRREKLLSLVGSGIVDMTQEELKGMRGKPRTE